MKPVVDYSIYLVTDEACLHGRPLLECVEEALAAGVTLVQYRAKAADGGVLYAEACKLKELCDKYNVPLIINDRLDIALAVGAAGVHLGQDDLPCAVARRLLGEDFIIGVSAHNPAEAVQAVSEGADYLGCGAVFGTATKHDVAKLGLENLRAIRKAVAVPMVGIGGITAENISELSGCGLAGVAVVSALFAQPDAKAAARRMLALSQSLDG